MPMKRFHSLQGGDILNEPDEQKKDYLLDYLLYTLGVCVFCVIGFSLFLWLQL